MPLSFRADTRNPSMPRGPEFIAGLLSGAVAALLVVALGLLCRRLRRRPAPVAGMALVIAALTALLTAAPPHLALILGALMLTLTGALATHLDAPYWLWMALMVPGAALVYRADIPGVAWAPHAVFLAVVVLAPAVADFTRRHRDLAVGPALALCSIGGVYVTVPDTEQARLLLGVGIPLAFSGWPLRLASLGPVGAPALVLVFAWTAATGGRGRASSVLAGIACLGVLALEPWVRRFHERVRAPRLGEQPRRRRQSGMRSTRWIILVGMTHFAYVLIASRGAGLLQSTAAAVAILAVATPIATLAVAWITRTTSTPPTVPKDH